MNLAILEKECGHFDRSAALYDRALALARSAGDRRFEGIVLGNRADLHWDAGEIEEAHAHYARALAIHREVGNRRFEGITLSNLGTAAAAIGDVEAARAAHREALAIHRTLDDTRFEGITLMESAGLARRVGNVQEAERLLAEAEDAIRIGGEKMLVALARCARGHLALARGSDGREYLEGARALACELGTRRESHLGRAVEALARAREAFVAGLPLVNGECPGDVPTALGGSRSVGS
jgi:tetratricopeptide (TPR) repeat protein